MYVKSLIQTAMFVALAVHKASVSSASVNVITADERQNLCSETSKACISACGSSSSAGTCDHDTLEWQCGCHAVNENINGTPIAMFPIPKKLCYMDLGLCRSTCEHINERDKEYPICKQQCANSFPCNTDRAPSYNGTKQLDPVASSSSLEQQASEPSAQSQESEGGHVSQLLGVVKFAYLATYFTVAIVTDLPRVLSGISSIFFS
ncbi:hypothetical protein VTP01DRAFT_6809 [Rhizomucor pusillus]|uniref:uncharacterized protein n=1 Tax=Rhizomucor pusillus TaxID=4840 RepID=UPI00374493F9